MTQPFVFEEFIPGFEGARQLARALRREMPSNFTWNFVDYFRVDSDSKIVGCALGLARRVWPEVFSQNVVRSTGPQYDWGSIGNKFGMTGNVAIGIFGTTRQYNTFLPSGITPEMVADKIDQWLASIGEGTSFGMSQPHSQSEHDRLREIDQSTGHVPLKTSHVADTTLPPFPERALIHWVGTPPVITE